MAITEEVEEIEETVEQEPQEIADEVLVEEVSIDGMCGVY